MGANYILVWVVVVALSAALFRTAAGTLSLTRPNLHYFIYYYSFLLSSLIGCLLIVLKIDNSYIIDKLINQETRVKGFYVISSAAILVPLLMAIVSKLLNFNAKKEFTLYWDAPLIEDKDKQFKKEVTWIITFFIVLCLSSIYYVFLKSGTIPLIDKLLGDERPIGVLRQAAKTDYQGNIYIKNIFALGLTPLLSLITYAVSVQTKEAKWRFAFLLLFLCSIVVNIYDFQKAPVIFYLLMFLLLRMYLGQTRLNLKRITGILAVGIVYLGLVYSLAGVKDLDSYLSYSRGPVGRIILTQISPAYIYLDRYGITYPYIVERGLPSLLLNTGDVNEVRSSRVLIEDLFPENVEAGMAGVLNTLFIGEAYATFGIWGVIFGACYLGILIQLLYIHFLRLPKHPIFVSLFVYFSINIPRSIVGGFSDLLFNPLWIFLYGTICGMYLIPKLRQYLFIKGRGEL